MGKQNGTGAWENSSGVSYKVKIYLLYDLVIPLLGVSPSILKIYVHVKSGANGKSFIHKHAKLETLPVSSN